MIVRTFDGLQALTPPTTLTSWSGPGGVRLFDGLQSHAEIYASQPNVRICVDFLARNCAQLAPHVFRRVSDTDRERLTDHDLGRWLGRPNPGTRRYRLIESLVADLGVYFNAYWLKVRYVNGDGRQAIGLVRLPPAEMTVKGGLLPTHFEWTAGGRVKEFPLSEIVYFNGYNPLNPLMGLSPLDTLAGILAEEAAATEHRESYWRNASRHEGVIERPVTAKKWLPEQKQSWREQWQQRFAGGANAGLVPVLEDGMTFKATSFSPRDSEYVEGGKLRREVCAAAYHIPQPMVGILEHATFSNIKEQHKHMYADTLGPWLELITQEVEGQLLPECDDQTDVYLEFNIAAKLAGSFEEQARSLALACGKPYLKVNEARAMRNLPRDDDPDSDRIAPQQGGPASLTVRPDRGEPDDDVDAALAAPVVEAAQRRLRTRLRKLPAHERATAFLRLQDRWTRELITDLDAAGCADPEGIARQVVIEMLATLAEES